MKIETLQWNIGGGKIRDENCDSKFETEYNLDGINHLETVIRRLNPHIITLQEAHGNEVSTQAEVLAKVLGYKYLVNDHYAESHIETGQELCQAVLSRFPLSNKRFSFIFNPKYEIETPKGEYWVSHNKGVTFCEANLSPGVSLEVMTVHMIPFERFGVSIDDPSVREILGDFMAKIQTNGRFALLQGDFNIDSPLQQIIPGITSLGFQEVQLSGYTTPKGRRYDHVLYKGLRYCSSVIVKEALTDHYPVYTRFETP